MPETLSFRQQAELVQQFCLEQYEKIAKSESQNKITELAKLTQFKLDAMEFFQRKTQEEFQANIYQSICEQKLGGNKNTMNELTTFVFEAQQVRTTTINGEPWFVGRDVATILGYAKPQNAISAHVDEDDRKGAPIQGTLGGTQEMTIINESGVYSLVFGSKLPEAKKFKHWVTSEVLPTIRKTGKYKIPDNPMEALKLMFDIQVTDNQRINDIETKVVDLSENALLTSTEYNYLACAVKKCVARSKMLFSKTINTTQAGMLYRAVSHDLNKYAGVRFRNQIRKGQFDDVCKFLESWELSKADFANISRAGEEHADVA